MLNICMEVFGAQNILLQNDRYENLENFSDISFDMVFKEFPGMIFPV